MYYGMRQVTSHRSDPTPENFKGWAELWADRILSSVDVEVELHEHGVLDRTAPHVFVANHQTALDIPILAASLPYPFGFVAKKELQRVPVVGLAMRHSPNVYVDRNHPQGGRAALRDASERIRAGQSVLLFPEGTRSYDRQLSSFKKGAFHLAREAGVPVVPVAICGSIGVVNEKAMTAEGGTVRVEVGGPIMISEGREALEAGIAQARAFIASQLDGIEA